MKYVVAPTEIGQASSICIAFFTGNLIEKINELSLYSAASLVLRRFGFLAFFSTGSRNLPV